MPKLDNHRILYEGIIDFFLESRMISFRKSLERIFRESFPMYIDTDGNCTLVFHCITPIYRKSHKIDNEIKLLIDKYKSYNDIGAIRIDKCYLTQPVIMSAYLRLR
jgi:hypothetical protein